MARRAHDWLSLAPLFLDTETTGLGNTAEALEIGLTDAAGRVIFETRLKPTVAIEAQAAAVHGIDEPALSGAPSARCGAAAAPRHRGPASDYL